MSVRKGSVHSHLPEYVSQVNPNDTKDLSAQYEKISAILNNPNMKLPDGGAKLKAKLQDIKTLLNASRSSSSITNKVSELSLNDKPEQVVSKKSNLLRAQHAETEHTRTVCMMSLEESMKLQELQQKDIKLANMRKRMESVKESVIDESELSLTMNNLQLDPETRQPRQDDDGSSDKEDSDDDDDDDYERYEDEGFDEEDRDYS